MAAVYGNFNESDDFQAGSLSPQSYSDSDRGGSSGRSTPRLREIVVIGGGGSTGASERGSEHSNSRRPSLTSSRGGSDAEYQNYLSEGSDRAGRGMKYSSSQEADLGSLPRSALRGLKVTISTNSSPGEYEGSNGQVSTEFRDGRNSRARNRKSIAGGKAGEQEEENGKGKKKEKRKKRKKFPTMADELPTEVTRMLLTILFERFDRNRDSSIDCDEFQRLISSCNTRRGKRRRPKRNDVLPLLRALDQDGDGSIQLDEFEGWVTKGFHMSLQQLSNFAEKGDTEAMLVDFLLALRADVKGIMRRIRILMEKHSTDGDDQDIGVTGFGSMCRARVKTHEEIVSEGEIISFLRAVGCENSLSAEDLRSMLCRSVINRGLSIMGRGQQRHRRLWVLIRRCGYYITDGEIDQLDMDDEADGYYDGGEDEGEESNDDEYDDEKYDVQDVGQSDANHGDGRNRRRSRRGSKGGRFKGKSYKQSMSKKSQKVTPGTGGLSMDEEEDVLAAEAEADLVVRASSLSTSTASFRSDNGMLPGLVSSSSASDSSRTRLRPHPLNTSVRASTDRRFPVTPLQKKGGSQYTLPPPLSQPRLGDGAFNHARNQIDVTPLQSAKKKHFSASNGSTPVPPPLNVGRSTRK